MDPRSPTCNLALTPFRGVECSDAVGAQVAYEFVAARLASPNGTTTGRQWDEYLKTPWFNYVHEDGSVHQVRDLPCCKYLSAVPRAPFLPISYTRTSLHTNTRLQVWYDDPESLAWKYKLAREFGLRGVGPYTFDNLDYTGRETGRGPAAAAEAKAMWDAFDAFLGAPLRPAVV